MPGYTHKFSERPRKKVVCPICQLPMRDPVQITTCGHRFCDTCLQEYLSEGIFTCPEDDLPLDYAKIYPDPDLHMEIINCVIKCTHQKEGCKWAGKLQNLQAHLETCRYDAMPCPNRCSAILSRLSLNDHVAYDCPKRKVTCEFCGLEFSGDCMDNHEGNCQLETVWCENKCGARIQRRFLPNHMKNECHKRTTPCRFCGKEFMYETLQTHQYNCPRYPVSCPNRCDPAKIPREEVDQHVQEQCPSTTIACTFAEADCKYRCPRFTLDKHLQDSMKTHLSLMCDLVKKQKQEMTTLRNTIQTLTHNTDGTLLWRITDYKSKMAESKLKSNVELVSQPFFTGRHGYKLSASVFLNGNGSGEGKFLSLYIKMLPGDYDNLLDWPFSLPISFTLYDQSSSLDKRVNIVESFLPDPTWKHFQKPLPNQEAEALGFGYPKFVSHEVLKTRNYIKDDAIYIKIAVDTKYFVKP